MKLLLFGTVAAILLFSFMPGRLTPAFVVNHDKAVHAAAFFILALMIRYEWKALRSGRLVLILGALGAGIEIGQHFFTDRHFSAEDLLSDAAGILFYIMAARGLFWLKNNRKVLREDRRGEPRGES